jgi:hypothetical protein
LSFQLCLLALDFFSLELFLGNPTLLLLNSRLLRFKLVADPLPLILPGPGIGCVIIVCFGTARPFRLGSFLPNFSLANITDALFYSRNVNELAYDRFCLLVYA